MFDRLTRCKKLFTACLLIYRYVVVVFFFSTTKPYLSLALCLAAQYLGNPRHTHTQKRLALPFLVSLESFGSFP